MLDPSSAPMCFNARLTTDVSSCARKTPRHVVTKTTGSAAAMPRWGGRFSAHASSDKKLRYARTCYDHIAGLLSVGLAERLAKREFVILGDEAGEVTPAGADFLSKLGVDLSRARAKRRVFCRPCVDWTERRPHIGGAVGAPVLRAEMDRTGARHARAHHYAHRTPRPDGDVRPFAVDSRASIATWART